MDVLSLRKPYVLARARMMPAPAAFRGCSLRHLPGDAQSENRWCLRGMSFRDGPQDQTSDAQLRIGNLEIPGSRDARPGMTVDGSVPRHLTVPAIEQRLGE